MKYLKLHLLVLIILIIGCKEDDEKSDCAASQYPLTEYFESVSSNSEYESKFWMDTKIHEVKFKMNSDGFICSIGYQRDEDLDKNLTIELIDENDVKLVAINRKFSKNDIEYVEFDEVSIYQNKEYILRRIVDEYDSISHTIGTVLRKTDSISDPLNPLELPLTINNFTILETDFYDEVSDGDSKNILIPLIDFGFYEN